MLRLVFVACHPVLPAQARLALTLRTVAGLTTEQIARVLLMTVPTVQQRIVRAKRTLAEAGVPFEVPDRAERPARLASVLQVIYLLFTEGYAAGGRRASRSGPTSRARRCGSPGSSSALMPAEPEVYALIALMEFQSSRFAARVDADGPAAHARRAGPPALGPVGDRPRARGAREGGGVRAAGSATTVCRRPSPSATRSLRLRRHRTGRASCALYDALETLAPSPVVRLNRAVAVSMADGPRRGARGSSTSSPPSSPSFRPLHAVRAELLERLGETDAAAAAFLAAAELPGNDAEAHGAAATRAQELARRAWLRASS